MNDYFYSLGMILAERHHKLPLGRDWWNAVWEAYLISIEENQ